MPPLAQGGTSYDNFRGCLAFTDIAVESVEVANAGIGARAGISWTVPVLNSEAFRT
jgi:hypothetical protein